MLFWALGCFIHSISRKHIFLIMTRVHESPEDPTRIKENTKDPQRQSETPTIHQNRRLLYPGIFLFDMRKLEPAFVTTHLSLSNVSGQGNIMENGLRRKFTSWNKRQGTFSALESNLKKMVLILFYSCLNLILPYLSWILIWLSMPI